MKQLNIEKTKYMFTSQKQNAGQNHNIKVVNEASKNVVQCKCFRMTATNESCMLQKIRSCFNLRIASYYVI
jgi:hypothetical protein